MASERITVRYLVNICLMALKQQIAYQSVTFAQCHFWVNMAVNRIKKRDIEKNGLPISGSYLITFTDVDVLYQTTNANNILKNRKYFQLPNNILDLDYDNGISYLFWDPILNPGCGQLPGEFFRTTLRQVRHMFDSPFKRPGKDENYYFVLLNLLVYLFGVEDLPVRKLNMTLRTTMNPKLEAYGIDDEIPLDDESVISVVNAVLSIGSWILKVPEEKIIEGADKRNVPAYKTLSAQEPVEQVQSPEQQQ